MAAIQMNFNRNLTRNRKKIKISQTREPTSSVLSSILQPSTTTTGTNVKTTRATTAAATTATETAKVSTSTSVGNNKDIIIKKNFISFSFTSCASVTSSSSIFSPHNKKITQLNYSKGMCERKTTTKTTTNTSTTTSAATPAAPTPAPTTTEVMLPLTSMSSEQITLTSRVNIMDKDVENIAVATAAARTYKTAKPLRPPPPITVTSWPILAISMAVKISRKYCLSIKMPLRHLILTIMTAVVLSMEFTICSSSSILHQQLTIISMPNKTHLPKTESKDKSSNINDNLQNMPVTSTTLRTALYPSSVPASSIAALDVRPPLKSLESAALVEKSPSTSSLLTSTFDDSSYAMLSTLTETATVTLTDSPSHQSSMAFDDAESNDSSELLSFPTSKLNTYVASDLPPLSEAEQAAKDLLTKGFSIPTYLPPFPVFAVADLPAYLNTVSTTTTTTTESPDTHPGSPDDYDQNSLENLLFFDNLSEHQQHELKGQRQHRKLLLPRRNSSLASANVTVQVGNHAYLPCHIHRLQNKPVSWVRLRDGHIISVDQTTFIADQRFQAIFQDDKEFTWSLQIKYAQHTDEGWYECQASSEPKMSAKVYLQVIVPLTELIGDQSRFVKAGSKVALHCIVRGTLDPPQYIIWYRDKTQISDDNIMGWYTQLDRNIFGNSGDNQNTIGSLIIPFVRKMDSGNYTCQPSNSASVSVDLHVLSGEYSASAIMSAARTYTLNDYYLLLLLFLLML